MEPYERLHAWQECHNLALLTYRVTKSFPQDEKYGLVAQARRAAFSAAANIVEGQARRGPSEFRRFLDISWSSLLELSYAMRMARDLGYLPHEDWSGFMALKQRSAYLVWQLKRSLHRSIERQKGRAGHKHG